MANPELRTINDDQAAKPRLKRTLSTSAIIFMVVAASAPLTGSNGVMPMSIMFSENSAAPTYFVIATAILILFSVGYTAMSKQLANAGAFYAYIEAGLGRIVGSGAALLATGAYALTVIALTVYAGPFAQQLVGTFTGWTDSPWWLWSLGIWAILAILGYRNIDLSARVLGVVLILEALVLVILGIVIFVSGGASGISLAPLNPVEAFSHGYPANGIMWAALVFVGFEATAVFRQEARNPEKTIPRATYGAVLMLGALYIFTSLFVVLGMGMSEVVDKITADPSGALFSLSSSYVSPAFTSIVNILLLGSVFACALSFQNVVNRYLLALGESGVLPRFVGQVHPKHHVPSNASLVISVIVIIAIIISAVLGLDPVMEVFTPLVAILAFAVITLMLLCSLAVIVYFVRKKTERPSTWVRLIAPSLATIALLYILVLSFSEIETVAGTPIAAVMVISLMLGLPALGIALHFRNSRKIIRL